MDIEKSIDALGRVVIPIDFRRKAGINLNSKVIVSFSCGAIIISPLHRLCALCGAPIIDEGDYRLCADCIAKIRSDI